MSERPDTEGLRALRRHQPNETCANLIGAAADWIDAQPYPSDDMTEAEEGAYLRGQEAVATTLINFARAYLPSPTHDAS